MSNNECGDINYKLTIFDEIQNPMLIRFTSDTSFSIPFLDLNIADGLINNYYWNVNSSNDQDLNFETDLFNFIINSEYLNNSLNLPTKFFLSEAFPNPFNPQASFEYGIPNYGKVSINIYNAIGQLIEVPINRFHAPGYYSFIWNPINISSGIYYIQLISSNVIINKKIVYLK